MKDDRCLIKDLQTEKKNGGGGGQTTNKRVSEQHYNLAWIFVIKHYRYFFFADEPLTSINQTCSVDISSSVCFTK